MKSRVFKITDTDDNVYHFRKRKDVIITLKELCGKEISLILFDNFLYHSSVSKIPTEIKNIDNLALPTQIWSKLGANSSKREFLR